MGGYWTHRFWGNNYCDAVIPRVDRQVDEAVYALCELIEDEIKIVEGGKKAMNTSYDTVYLALTDIYNRHRRKYKSNRDTKQMCMMWSTINSPGTIVDTKPIYDIEDAFDINLDEFTATILYDMNLDEAANKIVELQNAKS